MVCYFLSTFFQNVQNRFSQKRMDEKKYCLFEFSIFNNLKKCKILYNQWK